MHPVITEMDKAPESSVKDRLLPLLSKRAQIGIVGLGYVGTPLATEFARAGFPTTGFDIDPVRIAELNANAASFPATANFGGLRNCDCIVICVPSPLNTSNEPDVSHILSAARAVKDDLRGGQLIVLESTTYPGTTDELLLPLFRRSGFALDTDFLLAFSPERVDPGNPDYATSTIPKIVGGCSPDSTEAAAAMYAQIISKVYPFSSARVVEMAKLLENTFRAVNIGLVNEMARLCHELDIDIWEAIDAAKTKPFGFMPFYPGPGLGGHCVPLDPQYLSWKARQYGFESRFIDLAHQVNSRMPHHVISLVGEGLNEAGIALNGANVLVLGVAYKKDVDDARESPAANIITLLRRKKARVTYHDPNVPKLHVDTGRANESAGLQFDRPERRQANHGPAFGVGRRLLDPLTSTELTVPALRASDCVVIVADHTSVDYRMVVENAPLVVDCRNALDAGLRRHARGKIVRL